MDSAYYAVVGTFAALTIGVIIFCFWIAFSFGLWSIAMGVLSGCYLVTVLAYIRLLTQ